MAFEITNFSNAQRKNDQAGTSATPELKSKSEDIGEAQDACNSDCQAGCKAYPGASYIGSLAGSW